MNIELKSSEVFRLARENLWDGTDTASSDCYSRFSCDAIQDVFQNFYDYDSELINGRWREHMKHVGFYADIFRNDHMQDKDDLFWLAGREQFEELSTKERQELRFMMLCFAEQFALSMGR